jgi:hypothetical protein
LRLSFFFYFLLTAFFFLLVATRQRTLWRVDKREKEREREKDASAFQYFCNNTTYLWVKRSFTATHEAQVKIGTCVRILIHIIDHDDYFS